MNRSSHPLETWPTDISRIQHRTSRRSLSLAFRMLILSHPLPNAGCASDVQQLRIPIALERQSFLGSCHRPIQRQAIRVTEMWSTLGAPKPVCVEDFPGIPAKSMLGRPKLG